KSNFSAARMIVIDETNRLRLLILVKREPAISSIAITSARSRTARGAKNKAATFVTFAVVKDHSWRPLSFKRLAVGDGIRHAVAIGDDGNQLTILLNDIETFNSQLIYFLFRLNKRGEGKGSEGQQRNYSVSFEHPHSFFNTHGLSPAVALPLVY